MATQLLKKLTFIPTTTTLRSKTTSSQYVSSRPRDPTFEKLMYHYKNLLKVISIQDLILSTPTTTTTPTPSISLHFLSRLSQKLHLHHGPTHFLRKYPHIFQIFPHPTTHHPFIKLTPTAHHLSHQESQAISSSLPFIIQRLLRLLSMSLSKSLPLRAIFKVWKELGLPDDFESSVISQNSNLFALCNGNEPNTHVLKLVGEVPNCTLVPEVEKWRVIECCKDECCIDRMDIRYGFKHGYPPGMRLGKNFKAKGKEWQRLEYVGPYEEVGEEEKRRWKKSKVGMMRMEKRAVGIVHEFLSLTVEKMVEVEKISHFRKWFGIDLNIRDLFLDHPGIFYLSTKGKRHTVFLREAYERGCLIEPNPVYEARRKLLDLVVMGRRGLSNGDFKLGSVGEIEDDGLQEEESD